MEEKRKKLIDKIVKLFRLGGDGAGGTEAEMLLAVTKARQLMAEHAISMTEVESLKGADVAQRMDARIRQTPVYTRAGTKLAMYDWVVALAVGTLTDTEVFEHRSWGALGKSSTRPQGGFGRTISVLFVGDEDDVALAGELFHLWLTDVRKLARRKYGSGNSWTVQHTSYAIGVGQRLRTRAEEMVRLATPQQQQTWALVVSTKRSAIERWKQQHLTPPSEEKKKARDPKLDWAAYSLGYMDGGQVNMNTKLAPEAERSHSMITRLTLTEQEVEAAIEALRYYLERWPNEENRAAMMSAKEKLENSERKKD